MSLPLKPPLIIHHKAALDGQSFPPNSLEAIRASLDYGAKFIEVDITALADNDYLLVHDSTLESETTGIGAVGNCTAHQSRDLFYKLNGQPTSVHVPRLSEIVTAFLDDPSGAHLQLDFKNVYPFTDKEPLTRLVKLIEPLGDRVIVSTQADWHVRRLRKLAPWLDLGFDIYLYLDWNDPSHPRDPAHPPWKLGAYGYYDDHLLAGQRIWSVAEYLAERCEILIRQVANVSTFYINHYFLAQSLDAGFNWAEALHEANIQCCAWTLDIGNPTAEANAQRLLQAGVDQFTTNTPIALAALLNTT